MDILINNAGISANKFERTKQGFESNLGVNHLGHFLLTKLLADVLLKTPQSRVINVSSHAHRYAPRELSREVLEKINEDTNIPVTALYSYSKLANVLFTKQLQKELGEDKVRVVSLHPGNFIRTGIVYKFISNRWYLVTLWILVYPLLMYFTKNEEQGAQTTLHCALQDFTALSPGAYYCECRVSQQGRYAQGREDDAA